tara:strand:+ start:224 stop:550 length:327 start_codon:yes stop_codon:yes gene_type:complete
MKTLILEVTWDYSHRKSKQAAESQEDDMTSNNHTDGKTNGNWVGDHLYGRPSDIKPECLELYMRNARRLRANAFMELFKGGHVSKASDAMRPKLPDCKGRYAAKPATA